MTRAAGNSSFYTFTLNGRPECVISLPSVTSILGAVLAKNYLVPWGFKMGLQAAQQLAQVLPDGLEVDYKTLYQAAKEHELTPNQIRDKAGDKGTSLHEFFESMTSYKPFPLGTPDAIPFLMEEDITPDQQALWDWWRGQQVEKVIAREGPVWSLRHGFAGTLDLLYRETPPDRRGPGHTIIADLKSGSTFDEGMFLQLAAYRHAAETIHNVKADTGLILHIPAGSGKVTEHWRTGEELDKDFETFLHILKVYEARSGR